MKPVTIFIVPPVKALTADQVHYFNAHGPTGLSAFNFRSLCERCCEAINLKLVVSFIMHKLEWRHGTQFLSGFAWTFSHFRSPWGGGGGKGTATRKVKQLTVKSWISLISLFGPFCEELATLGPTFYQHAYRTWLTKFLVWRKISMQPRSLYHMYCVLIVKNNKTVLSLMRLNYETPIFLSRFPLSLTLVVI